MAEEHEYSERCEKDLDVMLASVGLERLLQCTSIDLGHRLVRPPPSLRHPSSRSKRVPTPIRLEHRDRRSPSCAVIQEMDNPICDGVPTVPEWTGPPHVIIQVRAMPFVSLAVSRDALRTVAELIRLS